MLPLFKVLVDNQSCHGGNFRFPPINKWTPPVNPEICKSGYHLTSDPLKWWKPKAKLYLAEGRKKTSFDGSDKIAFESVRLIQEVTRKFPNLNAYPRIRAFLAASERSFDKKADIDWVNLFYANLYNANLFYANLSKANLSFANLFYANLYNANLSNANLSNADLSYANLFYANLSKANLYNANLSNANLSNADLSYANLSNANLSGVLANLTQKDFFKKLGWLMDDQGILRHKK